MIKRRLYSFMSDYKPWIMIPLSILVCGFAFQPVSYLVLRLFVWFSYDVLDHEFTSAIGWVFLSGAMGLMLVTWIVQVINTIYERIRIWLYTGYIDSFFKR